MQEQQTNPALNLNLKFAAFLDEMSTYVKMNTPTLIDEGGCGKYAKLLAKKLKELGVSYKIISVESRDKRNNELFEKFVKDPKNNSCVNCGPGHVIILIEDVLYIDSNGIINSQALYTKAKLLELSEEALDKLVNESSTWNPTFDSSCLPLIESLLDKAFVEFISGKFTIGCFDVPTSIEKTDYTLHHEQELMDTNNLLSLLFKHTK